MLYAICEGSGESVQMLQNPADLDLHRFRNRVIDIITLKISNTFCGLWMLNFTDILMSNENAPLFRGLFVAYQKLCKILLFIIII